MPGAPVRRGFLTTATQVIFGSDVEIGRQNGAVSRTRGRRLANQINVLVAEDYPLVRHGLRSLLEAAGVSVVAEAEDGREAVRLAVQYEPEIALIDAIMPGLNGLDAAREILRQCRRTRCILLSRKIDEPLVLSAIRAGVSGYLVKSVASEVLVHGIRQVVAGGICLCPMAGRILADAYVHKRDSPDDPLSRREREILQLVAEGHTTKAIANRLGLSVKTAESHRRRIMDKLGIRSTAGLVCYAIRRGLIEA